MDRRMMVTALRNLALLVVVVMPFFFLLVWVQALLLQWQSTDLSSALETGAVYYLNNLLPVLVGGLLHQVAWLFLPQHWSRVQRGIVAVMLGVIIPLSVLVFWGGPAAALLPFVVPMILSLILYAVLLRPPLPPESPRSI